MKKKIIAALAMVLIVAMAIVGTYAYLTDTDKVTNTFTVGNVDIKLDEAPVDANGAKTTGDRVNANSYKLIPGHSYDKDPTVTVLKGSEACWVFVKVEDGLAAIEDATTIADQITAKGWTALTGVTGVYYKQQAATTEDTPLVVFETFKLKTDAAVADYANATITVTAYAIQQDGFTGENAVANAWAAVEAAYPAPATGDNP